MNKKVEPLFSKPIVDYLAKQKIIIVHSSQLIRQMIRKALSSASISIQNIELTNTYSDTMRLIEVQKPTLIFCSSLIEGKSFIELFNLHLDLFPNRLDASFIVIENDNSPSAIIRDMSYDVDGVVAEPLTLSSFVESLEDMLLPKSNPSPNERKFERGKILFRKGNFAEALEHFEEAIVTDPVNSLYYIAYIKYKAGTSTKAEIKEKLKEALVLNKKHYKSLDLLSKIYLEEKNYQEAYQIYNEMTKCYPINPEFIPNLVRVSISLKKYDEILALSNFFSTLEKQPSEINRSMSAGLAVCAKYFLEIDEVKKGIELYRKAALLSSGSVNIIKNIASNLISHGLIEQAEEILNSIKDSGIAIEDYEALMLDVILNSYTPEKTLIYAHNLLKGNLTHPYFFEVAYYCAHRINRRNIADDLYTRGIKLYPELKAKLDQIKAG